jgi:hypothetical protein
MKLYATMVNSKGRKEGIGDNESIAITLSNGKINIFDLTFTDDGEDRGKIEVMTYYNGEKTVIGYCEI